MVFEPIYVIEKFHFPISVDLYGPDYGGDSQIVGYYHEKMMAIDAVLADTQDISGMGVYQAVMIYEVYPGINPMNTPETRWYFLYDNNTGHYAPAAEPDGLEVYSL